MTSLAHTASTPRLGHPRANLRAYLAGVGATTALTSGVLVVFLSLATFVAFEGLPFGGSSDDAGAAYLGSNASAAPTVAAVALGAAPSAVAKHPVPGSHADGAGSRGSSSSGRGGRGRDSASGGADPRGSVPTDPTTPPGGVTPPPIDVPSPSGGVTPPPIDVPSPVANGLRGISS